MRIKMLKKQIQHDRIEKNLKVLKLLSNNDPSINEEQKREVINGYTRSSGRTPKSVVLLLENPYNISL